MMKIFEIFHAKKLIFCISLLFLTVVLYSNQSLAEQYSEETIKELTTEEITDTLNMIGLAVRNNYEQINTWSGEIDVKLNMLHTGDTAEEVFQFTDTNGQPPEAILQKVNERITFALDANKEFVYIDQFREIPSKYFRHPDGTDLGNSGSSPYRYTVIARPDFLIKAKPKSFKENKIYHKKAVKITPLQKDSRTGLYKTLDDPRKIFTPGAIFTWDIHDILVKKINAYGKIEFDGYMFKMEEHTKGDIIEYKVIQPAVVSLERNSPDDYVIMTKVFSSKYDFNLIDLDIVSGSGMPIQKFTWEYELIDGVYLPKRVVEKHYNSNGGVSRVKDSTYINNKLNHEIPPETFEYVNLKLEEGDLFIDEIANKNYLYKADTKTLEPIEK